MSQINILARRFILRLAQHSEEKSLLKKQLGEQSEEYVFKKLIEKNIIPIVAARLSDPSDEYRLLDPKEKVEMNQTSFLGSGCYSQVFEVSYKGKLAVAKVTETKSDYDIMLALDALRPRLGEDEKHLPVILDHFELPREKHSWGEGPIKYVIIVERLKPLNPHLLAALFPERGDKELKFKNLKNIDLIEATEKLFEKISKLYEYKSLKSLDENIANKLLELIETAFRKSLLSAKTHDDFSNKVYKEKNNIRNYFQNNKIPNISPDKFVEIDADVRSILDFMPEYIENIIGTTISFPYFDYDVRGEQDERAQHFLNSPEAKEFMDFLFRLKKEFGIRWGDTHYNNIMFRPSTGDLVITDSGYFKGVS